MFVNLSVQIFDKAPLSRIALDLDALLGSDRFKVLRKSTTSFVRKVKLL